MNDPIQIETTLTPEQAITMMAREIVRLNTEVARLTAERNAILETAAKACEAAADRHEISLSAVACRSCAIEIRGLKTP